MSFMYRNSNLLPYLLSPDLVQALRIPISAVLTFPASVPLSALKRTMPAEQSTGLRMRSPLILAWIIAGIIRFVNPDLSAKVTYLSKQNGFLAVFLTMQHRIHRTRHRGSCGMQVMMVRVLSTALTGGVMHEYTTVKGTQRNKKSPRLNAGTVQFNRSDR